MRLSRPNHRSLVLVASIATLIAMAMGPGGEARAATATETGFAVPGTVHRGNGRALHAPSGAGMPATVADFLAAQGHGTATLDSIRVKRQMAVGDSGTTVVDLTQEVEGLAVYGVQLRAIFDGDGYLTTLSENVVSAGPVAPAAIGAGAALDAALGEVHPGLAFGLTKRGSSGNSTSFGGDDFFYRDPSVTLVAVPMPGGALQEGFLVETWSEDDNQLDYTLVGGNGQVLYVQNRTNNFCADATKDCYKVFTIHPGVTAQTDLNGPGTNGPDESPNGWLDPLLAQYSTYIRGNNANAYLDRNPEDDAPDSVSPADEVFSPYDFDATANLAEEPTTAENQAVAVQNLFYLNNRIHDDLWQYGFTEPAGNFQVDNFNRGGTGNDPVNAEAQDGSGTNNANFATPLADGNAPRMQMFLWNTNGSSPLRDGDLDADIVIHEYGHGQSWRHMGGMSGVFGQGFGEGLSDVLAIVMTNEDGLAEYSYNGATGLRSARYGSWPADRTYETWWIGDTTPPGSQHHDGELIAAIMWQSWVGYRDDPDNPDNVDTSRAIYLNDFVDAMPLTEKVCDQPTLPTYRDALLLAIGQRSDPNYSDPTSPPADPVDVIRWCQTWDAFASRGVGIDESTSCKRRGPFQRIWEWFDGFALPASYDQACASAGSGVGPISDDDPTLDQVAENAPSTTTVGITAHAVDDGDNVTYSLTVNAGNLFAIDGVSGVVTVIGTVDAETATSHSITVEAASTDLSTSTRSFTIAVTDVNEAPVGAVTDSDVGLNEVAENASVDTPVGITAFAVDPDVSDNVSYSLTDSAGGRFAIDTGTGVITVNAALDLDGLTQYSVTVRADSDDGTWSETNFTIDEIPAPEQTVTLQDLGSTNQGKNWFATVGVTVAGAGDGVDVDFTWSWNGGSQDSSCLTANDDCPPQDSPSLRKKIDEVTFTVNTVGGIPLIPPEAITLFKP